MPLEVHYSGEQHLFVRPELPAVPIPADCENIKQCTNQQEQ